MCTNCTSNRRTIPSPYSSADPDPHDPSFTLADGRAHAAADASYQWRSIHLIN